MTRSPLYRVVAQRLLAHEWGEDAGQQASAAGRVYDRIFRAFAPIIGAAGVRAIFARSVRLSAAEFPCLEEVVTPVETHANYGQRLVACIGKLEADAASNVGVGLYAALLDLLCTFIGQPIVWQILHNAFPGVDMTGPKEKEQ